MALVPVFHGHVSTDGKLDLPHAEQRLRKDYLRRLAGKTVDITIKAHQSQRSKDLNAYWHAVPFLIFSEHLGYTVSEVKLVLLGECFGWRVVAGHEVPIKPSTSDLTAEEGTYFTDWMVTWGIAEHGVSIPLPNEVAT